MIPSTASHDFVTFCRNEMHGGMSLCGVDRLTEACLLLQFSSWEMTREFGPMTRILEQPGYKGANGH